MVTIQAQVGKFYFSDFLVLLSGESKQIDETVLNVFQLKDLLSSIRTKRLVVSTIDLEKIETAYASKNNSGGGTIDPSVLAGKEDKSNKVQVLGSGSATSYPSTAAVVAALADTASQADIDAAILALRGDPDERITLKMFLDSLNGIADLYNQLSTDMALKASQADFDTFNTNMSQTIVNMVVSLNSKQDKVEGKVLSTNDYTNTDKAAVATIKTYDITTNPTSGVVIHKATNDNDVTFDLYVPRFEDKVRSDPSTYYTQTLVETVPLYTLSANGEYVLTKPDEWIILNNSNFYIPSYHVSTISDQFAKGIVEFNVYDDEGDYVTVDVRHNITAPITDYTFEVDPLYCRISKSVFDGVELISSTDGSYVNMTLSIPRTTVSVFGDQILSASLAHPEVTFKLKFKTSDNKETAVVQREGFSRRAES